MNIYIYITKIKTKVKFVDKRSSRHSSSMTWCDKHRNQRWCPWCNTFIHSVFFLFLFFFLTEDRKTERERERKIFLSKDTWKNVVTNGWTDGWETAAKESEEELGVIKKKAQTHTAAVDTRLVHAGSECLNWACTWGHVTAAAQSSRGTNH